MEFYEYIEKQVKSELNVHVRFELGDPFKNGTEKRLKQVHERVVAIFEETFTPDEELYVIVEDWLTFKPKCFCDDGSTPMHVHKLLKGLKVKIAFEKFENWGDTYTALVYTYKGKTKDINYKEILDGIRNLEQGRTPKVPQTVYFISKDRKITFYMYDDRGCLVEADKADSIRHIYNKFNSWIVDYHREKIDNYFK